MKTTLSVTKSESLSFSTRIETPTKLLIRKIYVELLPPVVVDVGTRKFETQAFIKVEILPKRFCTFYAVKPVSEGKTINQICFAQNPEEEQMPEISEYLFKPFSRIWNFLSR